MTKNDLNTTKKYNRTLPALLNALLKQLLEILPTFLLSGILALSGSLLTFWLARYTDNPVWKLAKDAPEVIGYPAYYGMLSSWSSMLWMATAAVCLFTIVAAWKDTSDRSMQRFLLFSGLLSLILAMDDMYMLHDRILPKALGAPEVVFYALYFFLMAGCLIIFIRQIARSDYILFWIAVFFFAFSRDFYKVLPFLRDHYSANDMLKYFGIVFWLAFFARTAARHLRSTILSNPESTHQ